MNSCRLRNFKSAKTYFENCRNIDRTFLPAEQNLQTAKYALVERWHFSMLNDVLRNKSYAQAIFMEISHGFTNILDVGTGTGILSLFASKSRQCRSIVACDYSETMFEIATKVLEANNVSSIKLINKGSTLLSIPDDFKRKVTLLITEILDSGVFGENILQTLIHAWDHLLTPFPYGKVIPSGVAIYITAIQSDEISRRCRVNFREDNMLKINEMCLMHTSDPYDTENLRNKNVSYLTETQMALFVNFNNVLQLKKLYEVEGSKTAVTLKCIKSGRIETFAVWFTLQLNDTVTLTTDPNSPNKSCWDQAVQHLRHPLSVEEGQEITIQLSCFKGYLEIECPEATIKCPHKETLRCHLVPQGTILFLNDLSLMNYLQELVTILLDRFKDLPTFSVLDITPFPVLGLLLAQRGANSVCCVKDIFVESAVREMCELNSIDMSRVRIVAEREFNEFTSGDLTWDVVFHNLVSPCGLLCEGEAYQAAIMKMSLTSRGLYIPAKVEVWAQLVHCDWLDAVTKVDDRNCCGFRIAEFINEYRSTEHRDIDLSVIPHIPLTDPFEAGFIVDDLKTSHVFNSRATAIVAGRANAVFYWFEVTYFGEKILSTRREGAFAANAAFMLDPCVNVTLGAIVPMALKQHKGLMKIYVGVAV